MILIDYSAIAIANIIIGIKKDGDTLTKQYALHMILNSIRRYNKEFRNKYGNVIICCDSSTNWRNKIFSYYKFSRKKKRKEDTKVDWNLIYSCLEYVKKELIDNFSYIVIESDDAEADDVIGVLANYGRNDGQPVLIVSNDKDFSQLHGNGIKQFRPISQEIISEKDPKRFLKEHIIRGDFDDGIPNIKSQDDIFTIPDKRQKSIFKKEIAQWLDDDSNSFLEEDVLLKRNWKRNELLVDLSKTPKHIVDDIIFQYENSKKVYNKMAIMNFFMKNKLRYLLERISDF